MLIHARSIRLVTSILALIVLLVLFSASAVAPNAVVYAATGNWDLNGNAGIDPATNFLGTTDDALLTMRVNNIVGWRLQPVGANTPNVIGGNRVNDVLKGVQGATIAGGGNADRDNNALKNIICDDFGSIGGGVANVAGDCGGSQQDSAYATVSGGNHNTAYGLFSTIGGGLTNTAPGELSTVGGGNANRAEGKSATIGGGISNKAPEENATVGGGIANIAGAEATTIGGGSENTISAAASTIGGGSKNTIGNFFGTIGGGSENSVGGAHSTIGGGWLNVVTGDSAVVGGGWTNSATGNYATVPGGSKNAADGANSVALGHRAKANANGTFVFADSNDFNFPGNTANSFRVRATGGVRFVVGINGSGSTTWSCLLNNGASWSCSSDRNAKENFKAVNGNDLLERLKRVPILQWNAKGQDTQIKHFGPMAQDFYAAFALGDDDKTISTIDLDGVALASIQTLYQRSRAQDETISVQQQQIAGLEARLAALERSAPQQAQEFPMLLLWINSFFTVGALTISTAVFLRLRSQAKRA